MQSFVNKRAYSSTNDAAQTLEVFSAKLKVETDAKSLNNGLLGVIRDTMHTVHASP
jgi:hypothetical protein